jgi:hypothetical protein
MYCVTFSCKAGDAGNRYVNHISRKIMKKVKADDIILLHDVPPVGKVDSEVFLAEIEALLSGLILKGIEVVPLSVLINKEVTIVEKTGL